MDNRRRGALKAAYRNAGVAIRTFERVASPMDQLPEIILNSLTIVQRLRQVARKVRDSEFNALLADLCDKLADAKIEAANLKEEIAGLKTKLSAMEQMRDTASLPRPMLRFNCYKFEGDDGLFCTACYDTKGVKVRVARLTGIARNQGYYKCPACNAFY